MKPWVLLDCDGVLLDWDLGLQQYAQTHQPHVWDGDHMDEHAYDISSRMNITPAAAQQLIWDFHHSDDYMHVPPMPGAVTAVAQLHKFCKLVIITACGTQDQIVKSRKQNLKHVFGDVFHDVHCTDGFAEKAQYLQRYDPGYWIEDHARNAEIGRLYGHQCFLIDAPHNQRHTSSGVQRVHNITEAAEIILDILRATLQRRHQS